MAQSGRAARPVECPLLGGKADIAWTRRLGLFLKRPPDPFPSVDLSGYDTPSRASGRGHETARVHQSGLRDDCACSAAAPARGVKVFPLAAHDGPEIERAVTAFAAEPNGGLIVAPHAVTLGNRDLIARLAARHRLPIVYSDRYFAESGGLLSFGNNTADLFRRSATYIDRILKGAKPADLPVQLPTKFELIINLKTAKALGLEVPLWLQQQADEVIE
jgi:putative tryptophan/tyrosine transport system substrate-binding protein